MMFRIVIATSLLVTSTAMAAPTRPKAASALVITNTRAVATTEVAIGVEEQTIRLPKPLASQAKATLKLPKMAGCTVLVAASFEDAASVQLGEFDVCKDSTIRFTD